MPFVVEPKLWLCPSTFDRPGRLVSFHMNGFIITTNGLRSSEVRPPSTTLLIGESGQKTRWDQAHLRPDQQGRYLYDRPQTNHSGGGNATFVDGHVKWHHDSQWTSNHAASLTASGASALACRTVQTPNAFRNVAMLLGTAVSPCSFPSISSETKPV